MQFYNKLIGLPLFQGMSSSDLQEVVATVKFDFITCPRHKVVVVCGMPCKHLMILVSGSVTIRRECRGWSITETMTAPALIQPERLFGIRQNYTHTFTCRERCQLISLSKAETTKLMSTFLVFRLNMLNTISTIAQKSLEANWVETENNWRERILKFLRQQAMIPYGTKVFHILMQQLADELRCTRQTASDELNRLDREGVITLQRGIITIEL